MEINNSKAIEFLLGEVYLKEWEIIDGLNQHPKGLNLEDWLHYHDLAIKKINNHDTSVDLLLRSIPYPEQVQHVKTEPDGTVCFNWRSCRYKFLPVSNAVYKVDGAMLHGNDTAILIQELVKRTINNGKPK